VFAKFTIFFFIFQVSCKAGLGSWTLVATTVTMEKKNQKIQKKLVVRLYVVIKLMNLF